MNANPNSVGVNEERIKVNSYSFLKTVDRNSPTSVKLCNNKSVLLTQNLVPFVDFGDVSYVDH